MKILAVGDIVGSAGIRKLKKELPQIIENADAVDDHMHQNGTSDGAGLAVAPAQTVTGGQILQKTQQKHQRRVRTNVAHHVDGGKGHHGNQIGGQGAAVEKFAENETPINHFFRQRYQKDRCHRKRHQVTAQHFKNVFIVDIGEIGVDVQNGGTQKS